MSLVCKVFTWHFLTKRICRKMRFILLLLVGFILNSHILHQDQLGMLDSFETIERRLRSQNYTMDFPLQNVQMNFFARRVEWAQLAVIFTLLWVFLTHWQKLWSFKLFSKLIYLPLVFFIFGSRKKSQRAWRYHKRSAVMFHLNKRYLPKGRKNTSKIYT